MAIPDTTQSDSPSGYASHTINLADSRAALHSHRETAESKSVEVLELELQLCGFRAHLSWSRGDMRQVIGHLEEAQVLIEGAGGQFTLIAPRVYLAEQVAFYLALRGFEALDACNSGTPPVPFERRELVRLLDLGLTLLGDLHTELDDTRQLRDFALRLRALICIQDKEMDLAAQSLNQHSTHEQEAPDAYVLLRAHLLFNSNQPAEAQAHTLNWLRAHSSLSPTSASTAIDLLLMHDAVSAALTAVTILSERLRQRESWCVGSDESKQYSELQEVREPARAKASRPLCPCAVCSSIFASFDPMVDIPRAVARSLTPASTMSMHAHVAGQAPHLDRIAARLSSCCGAS